MRYRICRTDGTPDTTSSGSLITDNGEVIHQELVTSGSTQVMYWEGAVDAAGSFGNVSVSGQGYVEMTGYDRAFRQP